MRFALWLSWVVLFAVGVAGCEPDLGACDMNAATEGGLVYGADGTPYYAGQALVQTACANGVCHSSGAVGPGRVGAPHYLNFDVGVLNASSTPQNVGNLRAGISTVRDEAGEMYSQLSDDLMPPGKAGERVAPMWKNADGSAASLPAITTAEGKSTVRNWLACNAPIVAGVTGAPADAMQLGTIKAPLEISTTDATFTSVYTGVLTAACATCHDGKMFSSQTPLDFTTQAKAFATLVGPDVSGTGSCVGKGKLVTPNNCDTSVLYQKLLPAPVSCGAPMPLGTMGNQTQRDLVCNWIKAGAKQ